MRPQDVSLVPDLAAAATVRGHVWVVELIGSEKLVEVALGDRRRMTVQVRADVDVRIDDPVGLRLDARQVHLFDVGNGCALR